MRFYRTARGNRIRDCGGQVYQEFARSYRPKPSVIGHLRFALRYEGLNLEVLSQLFARIGGEEIHAALLRQPRSVAARRLGYLYEWLIGEGLDLPDTIQSALRKARCAPVLDESMQFGIALESGPRNGKYHPSWMATVACTAT